MKLTKEQEAIILLADYLEDHNHADYKVKKHIMEILGIEFKPVHNSHTSPTDKI